ncbi:MAG: TraR/DksA family transcriptional regulator [Ignavibacteriaceae bacterium]
MAKKLTSKKSVAKKPIAKKSDKDLKKSKKKTAPASKPAVKKVSKKATASPAKIKKATKQKTIDKKAVKKSSMAKTKVKEETVIMKEEVSPSTSEIRQKAIAKIKGYSKKDLEHFRTIILAKRDEIIEQLQNLKEQMLDPTTGEYINENSPYSLHMAEQGTDAMEREKTFLYAQRENKFLGYLEDALKRIDTGTYGICVECIDEPQHLCPTCPLVPKARLEAVPHSQLCLPIKQKQEKK